VTDAASPRWRGQPGRLEVWYATATDAATGLGLWLHYELVAPVTGPAYVHGWIAAFPPDLAPSVVRFGPHPADTAEPDWVRGPGFSIGPDRLTGGDGSPGSTRWDLGWEQPEAPLWTMTERAWRRELLPSSQVVVAPHARLRGTVRIDRVDHRVDAVGSVAHIYGHGNADRWAWLHADLDDETTLEIVAAVGRRPAMRHLPPLSFVQLRRNGSDWPGNPVVAAPLFRARLGFPDWSVRGIVGTHRLRVTVAQPEDRCVYLDYTDPDGATAICANSEAADADVRLERWAGRWKLEQEWSLRGRAHAERGYRP
jgi:hypothetical protein